MWLSPNPEANAIFSEILGQDAFSTDIRAYTGRRFGIFLQLFTLKLWLDQRLH
jgi:hypothetical protein